MKSARTALTIALTGSAAILVPVVLVMLIRATFARMITTDNAGVVFAQFQAAIDQGNQIRDPVTAAAVADQAYRNSTHGNLLDGWNNTMHIYATVQGTACTLSIQSAGPNGHFGDSDDVTNSKTFDLTPGKARPVVQHE